MVSLEYPIDGLNWALFTFVILYHQWFPRSERFENRAFILPRSVPAVLIIFAGRGGEPPLPAGLGVHPWCFVWHLKSVRGKAGK